MRTPSSPYVVPRPLSIRATTIPMTTSTRRMAIFFMKRASHVTTPAGIDVELDDATPSDHEELRSAFARIVDAGEGFPQSSPLTVDEFRRVWIDDKSAVVVAPYRRQLGRRVLPQAQLPGT